MVIGDILLVIFDLLVIVVVLQGEHKIKKGLAQFSVADPVHFGPDPTY